MKVKRDQNEKGRRKGTMWLNWLRSECPEAAMGQGWGGVVQAVSRTAPARCHPVGCTVGRVSSPLGFWRPVFLPGPLLNP